MASRIVISLLVLCACNDAAPGAGAGAEPAPGFPAAGATPLLVSRVSADLTQPDPAAAYWADAPGVAVSLVAQPMVAPRPETTNVDKVMVQAVHDGKQIAFRMSWRDPEKSEAGRLGEFSDALALEFPVRDVQSTPVMMGAKDYPVHIFHWRAQYQRDKEHGKPTIPELYPNVAVDMYAMDFKEAPGGTASDKESFSPGLVAGNPQSYEKTGVDEVMAEGFSTSAVQEGHSGAGHGVWANGEWSLVITRPLAVEGGSVLAAGAAAHVAFAAWQGGKGEVGSRKSVTMSWLALEVSP